LLHNDSLITKIAVIKTTITKTRISVIRITIGTQGTMVTIGTQGTMVTTLTNFFVIKPIICSNFTNLFWHETLHVSDSSFVHHQEFIHCTLSNGIPLVSVQ
jgi:hypothetical protein